MNDIQHYGMPRRSGRYPWGSGENPYQGDKSFLGFVKELEKQGLTEKEIVEALGFKSTTQLRARRQIAIHEERKAKVAEALRLKEKGLSTTAIGERMGIGESSVRSLLNPASRETSDILFTTANTLKDQVLKKTYLDVGEGTENFMGISKTKLNTAISILEEEGYSVHYVKVPQLGTGNQTTIKVLVPPNTTYSEILKNREHIKPVTNYSEDNGRSYLGLEPPKSIDSKRIEVRYKEEGGGDKDGVIELRRGVDDISLGSANYAQVRIAVDGTHFLKGVAVYADDLPKGVDLRFNTDKSPTGNIKDAFKKMKRTASGEIDPDNPFGSTIKREEQLSRAQRHYIDKDGKKQLSPINIVYEEGDWDSWSRSLSSQVLSKQRPELAKQQLGLLYSKMKEDYDEISSLTNPAIKKKLLLSFADDCDASASHLKAAALPRQNTKVIIPISSMKDNEVYAPSYRNGEKVVLIRHPHGGRFEIPELIVNNKNKEARRVIPQAKDAIGINSKVASRMSGADFDGDSVLIIPDNSNRISTAKKLDDFDPKVSYKGYPGMKVISEAHKQRLMGDVSNLITDMTIRGANLSEIEKAVRHSMVVIDAENHKLNYKQSHIDHNISELKRKYQGSSKSGAKTLISRAGARVYIDETKPRPYSEGGPIDKKTGKKVSVPTDRTYVNKAGKTVRNQERVTGMSLVDDAYELSSGTMIESVYASHANQLKALANQARKDYLTTKSASYSPTAAKTYSKEVSSLKASLNVAYKNKPLERRAQSVANGVVRAKRRDNPDMDQDTLKKVQNQALTEARYRIGAKRSNVIISPKEWEAIQMGAVSNNMLENILQNTDLDELKKLATPRSMLGLTPSKKARAMSMLSLGYTQAEVAESLGVSTSTISDLV